MGQPVVACHNGREDGHGMGPAAVMEREGVIMTSSRDGKGRSDNRQGKDSCGNCGPPEDGLGTGLVAVTERDGLIIDGGQDSCGSCGTPEDGLGTVPVAVTERDG